MSTVKSICGTILIIFFTCVITFAIVFYYAYKLEHEQHAVVPLATAPIGKAPKKYNYCEKYYVPKKDGSYTMPPECFEALPDSPTDEELYKTVPGIKIY